MRFVCKLGQTHRFARTLYYINSLRRGKSTYLPMIKDLTGFENL